MDILTLCLAHEILTQRSIRKVARRTGRSPSTVSGALTRIETEIAVPLVRRGGTNLVLTLEAERRLPQIASAVAHIERFLHEAGLSGDKIPLIRIDLLMRFSSVVHSGSIRASARSLGVGQPQLTRQMADLERLIGGALLGRSVTGVRTTALGKRLVPIAEAIVADWETISRAASVRFRRDLATWRIGTVVPLGHESSIARMLANLVVNWAPHQNRHPLQISSHTADELMIGLKSRRFDLIVLDHSRVPHDFNHTVISSSPLALVGSRAVMAGAPDVPTLLLDRPLVLPSERSGIRLEAMRYFERVLSAEQLARLEITEINSIPVIINLVAYHDYISVLPQGSLTRLPFQLTQISIAPDHMQTLAMVWRRSGLPDTLLDAVYRSTVSERSFLDHARGQSAPGADPAPTPPPTSSAAPAND